MRVVHDGRATRAYSSHVKMRITITRVQAECRPTAADNRLTIRQFKIYSFRVASRKPSKCRIRGAGGGGDIIIGRLSRRIEDPQHFKELEDIRGHDPSSKEVNFIVEEFYRRRKPPQLHRFLVYEDMIHRHNS
ncbi:hypothetical protein EVAR_677_1 [Eumeta japonica]|uniref:Uncharacterized protein n=1 Tax=Eumeta variegata TaxID=151549 RepID=A0A4C1SCB6_EUMVA|nr:hypothetical protein EVAR_677_1 [Eumeta japonica]